MGNVSGSSMLVVVFRLKKIDLVFIDTIDQAIFMSDPAGPEISGQMLQWLWLALAFKQSFQDLLHQIQDLFRHSSVHFHPLAKVLSELLLNDADASLCFTPFCHLDRYAVH